MNLLQQHGWQLVALGALAGALTLGARRVSWLAWVALVPLTFALYQAPSWEWAAGVGAAIGLLLQGGSLFVGLPAGLPVFACTLSAATWAVVCAAGKLIWSSRGAPLGLLLLPAASVLATVPLRVLGAPRWFNNPLASTQERSLFVLHAAGRAGDLMVSAMLALSGSSLCMLFLPEASLAGAVGLSLVAAWLAFGHFRERAARMRIDSAGRVRVAAVAADARGLADEADLSRNVTAAVRRYDPQFELARRAGARLVVMPEVAVIVGPVTRDSWFEALTRWARAGRQLVVAGFYDELTRQNMLVVVHPSGEIFGEYEKQHPGPHEPKRHERTPPLSCPPCAPDLPAISAVICADLDYADLLRPVSRVGGLLVVPANDWPGLEMLHHRTAVWSAVAARVPIVRATGHGISAIYDASGRVLAQACSLDGPVMVVADVPLTEAFPDLASLA